jgi:hypothetical protein
MANEPVNPSYANNVVAYPGNADSSNVESVTGGGSSYFGTQPPVVTSNSHPIAIRADQALWDVTSGAYVSIQNTTVGTTTCPKNGQ